MTTYAIGDIHGMYDLLFDLANKIKNDMDDGPHKIIYLGDYIDRGPDSAGVIDFVKGKFFDPHKVVALLGNHEQMLLDAYFDGKYGNSWYMNGAEATLNSYGGTTQDIYFDHITWLRDRPLSHIDGKYLFVHAGINPLVSLEKQLKDELLWIREDFLRSKTDHGYKVIHGHTPTVYWIRSTDPDVNNNRIGIDTGSTISGVLTAIKIPDTNKDEFSFIQAIDQKVFSEYQIRYGLKKLF